MNAPRRIPPYRPRPEREVVARDCGDVACDLDWLSSPRHSAEVDDVMAFTRWAMERGFGDGLPLIPPTEARVRAFLAGSDRYPDEVICTLPPANGECTVEKIAINAVMAGAPPESLSLLIAALEALADPDFELFGLNTTTAPVVPLLLVNGPIRHRLGIPHRHGCLGGEATQAVAIGRAIRLLMRNVGGQVVGVTSQSTFGTPGRVAGILFGEWEERSPWPPLAERRGVAGDAVTCFGAMGTQNVLDTTSRRAVEFLEMIGKSAGYVGCNGLSPAMPYAELLIALNPVHAELIHREIPDLAEVQELLWRFASLPADWLTPAHREQLEAQGRVIDGRVYLCVEPKDVLVVCCGGTGGLHATVFHSFGSCIAQTRRVRPDPRLA
ncbi:MAG: hypothetical protein KatS3mg124_2413 [Porticoccaceae bacterium]|nr:MAG: hypothetical protein KatS3mg124_2413 [Porticoccaceae bacterium]